MGEKKKLKENMKDKPRTTKPKTAENTTNIRPGFKKGLLFLDLGGVGLRAIETESANQTTTAKRDDNE